jgi:hypothetical protein
MPKNLPRLSIRNHTLPVLDGLVTLIVKPDADGISTVNAPPIPFNAACQVAGQNPWGNVPMFNAVLINQIP